MRKTIVPLWILVVAVLSACEGEKNSEPSSSTDPDSISESNPNSDSATDQESGKNALHFSLQLLGHREDPVPGKTVVLHGADDISVDAIRISGANGVVDFGEIEREKVTISVFSRMETGYTELTTIFDLDRSHHELRIASDSEQPDCYLTYYKSFDTNGSASMDYLITTGSRNYGPALGFGDTVCSIQDDGNVSAIAFTNFPSLYGISLDQKPSPYASDFNEVPRTPILLQYEPSVVTFTGLGAQITGIELSAYHRGQYYSVYNPDRSGTSYVSYADQFPVDKYIVYAEFQGAQRVMLFDSLYSHIDIPSVDTQFFDTGYDVASKLVYWNRSGSTDINLQIVNINMGNEFGSPIWRVYMPASRMNLTVPDLPPEILDTIGGPDRIPYSMAIQGWSVDTERYGTAVSAINKRLIRGEITHSHALNGKAIPVPGP